MSTVQMSQKDRSRTELCSISWGWANISAPFSSGNAFSDKSWTHSLKAMCWRYPSAAGISYGRKECSGYYIRIHNSLKHGESAHLFVCLFGLVLVFQDRVFLSWNSLCRPGWSQTQRSACFYPLSARIKGVCHHCPANVTHLTGGREVIINQDY